MIGLLGRYRATLVAGILVAAAFVMLVIALLPHGGAADTASLRALVHDSNGAVHELALSEDAELTVTTSKGSNTVVVRDGAVSMLDADCENHDCMRQGSLSSPGGQIICLPHELWIEVVASGAGGGRMDVEAVGGGGEFDTVSR